MSAPAYGNVRLSQEETNEVYLELVEFLLSKSLYALSKKCLEYLEGEDTKSVRVLFAEAKAKMLQLNYQEAAVDLEHIFKEIDETQTDAYIQYAHCKFLLGEYEEARIAYYQAIRICNLKGNQLKDSLVHQRIGAILIN